MRAWKGPEYINNPDTDEVTILTHVSMRRDIFGKWGPHTPGHQGYNWRDLVYNAARGVFYGVHPKSAFLFEFDPDGEKIRVLERICSEPLRQSGGYEPFRCGYLTLRQGTDGETLYYLTGGPRRQHERRDIWETTHLVTFDLHTGTYRNHGMLRLEDGRFVNMSHSLAVGGEGRLYACPWIERLTSDGQQEAKSQVDLISFADPLAA